MGKIAKIMESVNKSGVKAISLTDLQAAEIRGANRDESLQAGMYFRLPDDLTNKVFPEPRFNNTPYVIVDLCTPAGDKIEGEGARLFLSSLTKRVARWQQEGKNVVPVLNNGKPEYAEAGGTAVTAYKTGANQAEGLAALQGKLIEVSAVNPVVIQSRNNPGQTALTSVMVLNFVGVRA